LQSTFELVGSQGVGAVAINDIAAAAGVAKQTIYRWWPSRTAVILDALVAGTMKATPFPETADVRADFVAHLTAVTRLFNSSTGRLICELVAAAQADPKIRQEFDDRFWTPRRVVSKAMLMRGVELGQIRSGLDTDAVLDAIYGPLWVRLLVGHTPLRPRAAATIVDTVWQGIATGGGDQVD
jgi:AcrR family transcriptional regulator